MVMVSEKKLILVVVFHVSKLVLNVLLEEITVNVVNVKRVEKNLVKLQN